MPDGLKITETQIYILRGGDSKLKGFATVIFNNCWKTKKIKIILGREGLFIAYPSIEKRGVGNEVDGNKIGGNKDGGSKREFDKICYPINRDMAAEVENAVLKKYNEQLAEISKE